MKDLIKKQDEEFEMMRQSNGVLYANEKEEIINFISKVRKETAEYVANKMTGDIMPNPTQLGKGWNDRIRKENRIKQQILKEL